MRKKILGRSLLAVSVLMGGFFAAGAEREIQAAEDITPILVTTAADTVDSEDGLLSLREAAALAGTTVGENTYGRIIKFDPAVFAEKTTIPLAKQENGLVTITINQPLTIDAAGADVTIDGQNQGGSVFAIAENCGTEETPVCLKSLKITGGQGAEYNGFPCGGGLFAAKGSRIYLEGCEFFGNEAMTGGGVCSYADQITVNDCRFAENKSGEAGAGLFADAGLLVMANSVFEANKVDNPDFEAYLEDFVFTRDYPKSFANARGGGVHIGKTASAQIYNSTFVRNSVRGIMTQGGGLYIDELMEGITEKPTVTVADCTFEENESIGDSVATFDVSGGGIYANFRRHSEVLRCRFAKNNCISCRLDENGNRIVSPDQIPSVEDGGGGALYNDGKMEVDRCLFDGNSMTIMTYGGKRPKNKEGVETGNGFGLRFGGGAFCGISGWTYITNSKIIHNCTHIYSQIRPGEGVAGAGGLANVNMELYVENTLIADNNVWDYTSGEKKIGGIAGGIAALGPAKVINCTIANNSAMMGAGVFAVSAFDPASFTAENSIIVGNTGGPEVARMGQESLKAFNTLAAFTEWDNAQEEGVTNFVFNPDQPLFIDSEKENYRLAENSQAIDKGDHRFNKAMQQVSLGKMNWQTKEEKVPSFTGNKTEDLAGHPRIEGNFIDLGAFEFFGH